MTFMSKPYPDSTAGAISMLKECSSLPDLNWTDFGPEDLLESTPDPMVKGVWLLRFRRFSAICYLAGHEDPWGRVRKVNSFEIEEPEEDE